MDGAVVGTLSLALGLGLLIGLQRERAKSPVGGIRTFPLIALLGAICGLLAAEWDSLVVVAGFLGVISMTTIANWRTSEEDEAAGQTSVAAALLTYALGALLATQNYAAAVVVGGITAVLLQFKRPMHRFAGGMSERDIRAVMRFVIVTLIVLPVLPDQAYGPYAVLNPREIWWMVVLIVGLGMSGYVSYLFFRDRVGVVLGGIFGGIVSSTATTVAYARRVKDSPQAAPLAAVIIAIASAVSVVRVMVEIAVVAPQALLAMAPPLLVLLAVVVLATVVMFKAVKVDGDEMPEQENPAELKSALIFGALYGTLIFVTAAMQDYFGDQALFAVALVSGFVNVDAITLSTAQLAAAGRLEVATAWKVVLIALIANFAFKSVVALVLGSARLLLLVSFVLGAATVAGLALLLVWPDA